MRDAPLPQGEGKNGFAIAFFFMPAGHGDLSPRERSARFARGEVKPTSPKHPDKS